MASWFGPAGLTLAETRTLEGGELTVKLWLGVKKGLRPVETNRVKAA